MNTSRKKNGQFAGKDKVTAFLGLLAIFGMAGYAAWYWLSKPVQPVPFVASVAADEMPCGQVATSTYECSDPALLKKLAVEHPDGIKWYVPVSTSTEPRPYMGHLGYDITRYATDPQHEAKVAAILNKMPGIRTAAEAEKYIRTKFPKSPLTGYMVFDAGKKYDVPLPLILAIVEQDSAMGTAGLGAKTRNPGNVNNNDAGNVHYYPTWSEGVEGVARWLSKHKI